MTCAIYFNKLVRVIMSIGVVGGLLYEVRKPHHYEELLSMGLAVPHHFPTHRLSNYTIPISLYISAPGTSQT